MIRRLLKHGVVFVFAKSIVLIAPLFAAYLLDKASYGKFEWALSVAMVVSTLMSFGSGNTIAFEKVKTPDSKLITIGQKYSLFLSFIFSFISLICLMLGDNHTCGMIFGLSAFLIIQYALSADMKASGLGARASVVDSGIYIVLFILLLFTWALEVKYIPYLYLFSLSAWVLGSILSRTIDMNSTITNRNVEQFIKRGFPIMLSGGMVIIFFNVPKMMLGANSMTMVGEFSLYFRWAALVLVVYQFVVIVFFRDLYTKSMHEFDKFIASICMGVFLLGFIVLGLLYGVDYYEITFLPLPSFNLDIELVMVGIITLWAITASLEGLLYRENKSIHQMWANILGLIVFVCIYFIFYNENNIIYIVTFSWFLSFMVIILYQLFIIHRTISKDILFFINSLFVGTGTIIIFLTGVIL